MSLLYPQAPGSLAKLITVYSHNTTNANNSAHTLTTPTNNSLSGSSNTISNPASNNISSTSSSGSGEAVILSLHTTKRTKIKIRTRINLQL